MRKIVLTFGLVAGLVLSVMMLVTLPFMDRIGYDKGLVIGYTTMVMAFLAVYFGVRSYRDNVAGGRVTFGRAMQVGLLITLVASACYVATWEVVYYRLAPDFGQKYSAYAVDKARRAGASEAELAAKQREMAELFENYKKPLVNIAYTFLEPLPVGVLFTIVSAVALTRKRRVGSAEVSPG
jgi:cation transport ATPase